MSDAGLVPVPAVVELVADGKASVVERNRKSEPTVYMIGEAGYDAIFSAMSHNASVLKCDSVLRRERETAAIKAAKQGRMK